MTQGGPIAMGAGAGMLCSYTWFAHISAPPTSPPGVALSLLYALVGALIGLFVAAYLLIAHAHPLTAILLTLSYALLAEVSAVTTGASAPGALCALLEIILACWLGVNALRATPAPTSSGSVAETTSLIALLGQPLSAAILLTTALPAFTRISAGDTLGALYATASGASFFIGAFALNGASSIRRAITSFPTNGSQNPALQTYNTLWPASSLILTLALTALAWLAPQHALHTGRSLAPLLCLLAIGWRTRDAPRHWWLHLLSPGPAWKRLAALLSTFLGAVSLIVWLALAAPPALLLALGATLVAIGQLQRRLFSTILTILLGLPIILIRLVPTLDATLPTTCAHTIIRAATYSLAATTIASGNIMSLAAIFSALLLATLHLHRAYRRLLPTSAPARMICGALGLTIFVTLASLVADPLPAIGASAAFWLTLGLAYATSITAGALARLRQPVRVAIIIDDTSSSHATAEYGAATAAITRYISHTLQQAPTRVTPIIISARNGPLAHWAQARGVASLAPLIGRPCPTPDLASPTPANTLRARWLILLRQWRPAREIYHELRQICWATHRAMSIALSAQPLRPDLLISFSTSTHGPALLAGNLLGVPTLWRALDIAPTETQTTLDALAPWTAGVLASSQTIARSFHPWLLRRIVRVLRPGVPPQSPSPSTQRAATRQALGIPPDAPLALVYGTPSATSGHEDALQAYTLLLSRAPHLRMVFAAEAPILAYDSANHPPESQASRRLRQTLALTGLMTGATVLGEQECLATLLSACDLIVFPQRSAPLSDGILLALAHATPIIATRVGAHVEQLTDAWGYTLVEPANPTALAEAIGAALAERVPYQIAARRNPTIARDLFSSTQEAARLNGVFLRVAAHADPTHSPFQPRQRLQRAAGAVANALQQLSVHFERLAARSTIPANSPAIKMRAWQTTLWSLVTPDTTN